MNDRIYEMINQCFIGTTNGELSDLNTINNVEKFAVLLIKECGKVADDYTVDCEGVSFELEEVLALHFGVKE